MAAASGCQREQAPECATPKPDEKRCKIDRSASKPATARPAAGGAASAGQAEFGAVSLEGLTPDQRKLFAAVVEDQFDPCGEPRSFGETLRSHADKCPVALELARYVVRQVKAGHARADIVVALIAETRRLNHKATFRLDGRPRRGPTGAQVVVVEFFDYECPYCREVDAELKRLLERHPGAALVAKQCPIEGHVAAEAAAKAALAAARQGKYWEMHAALFKRGAALDETAIEAAAREAGLNLERFRADRSSEAVARTIREDIEDADRAAIEGTPSFWVDGVEVPFDRLQEVVAEKLAAKGSR